MNKVKILLVAFTLALSGCEKEPTEVKRVFCYDCYREYFEISQEVEYPYGIPVKIDTLVKNKTFLMQVCMAPEDMNQIELYEGESSLIFISMTTKPNILGWIKKIEKVKCYGSSPTN